MDAILPVAGAGRLVLLPSLALRWSFQRRLWTLAERRCATNYRPPFSLVNDSL
jgi:hypothetical protein